MRQPQRRHRKRRRTAKRNQLQVACRKNRLSCSRMTVFRMRSGIIACDQLSYAAFLLFMWHNIPTNAAEGTSRPNKTVLRCHSVRKTVIFEHAKRFRVHEGQNLRRIASLNAPASPNIPQIRKEPAVRRLFWILTGGGGGIRTLVTRITGKTVFETAAFNHSATPPRWGARHEASYAKRAEARCCFLAERWGFEPQIPFWGIHDFQSCSFGQLGHLSALPIAAAKYYTDTFAMPQGKISNSSIASGNTLAKRRRAQGNPPRQASIRL